MSAAVANKVANVGPITGVTGSVASHAIYTPTSDALLRVAVWISAQSDSDPASSADLSVSCLDMEGNIGQHDIVMNGSTSYILQCKANEPLSLRIDVTESAPGVTKYAYQVIVEEL